MVEVRASANFSSVVKEINDVSQAYRDYAKAGGKAVSANVNLVRSFKALNTAMNETANLISNVNKPLRDYTKNFNTNTGTLNTNATAVKAVTEVTKQFAISSDITFRDMKGNADKLKALQFGFDATKNTVVKTRDALTGFAKSMSKATKSYDESGKAILNLNGKIRASGKDIKGISAKLVTLRKRIGLFKEFEAKVRKTREETRKLNAELARLGAGSYTKNADSITKASQKAGKAIARTSQAVKGLTLSMQTFTRLALFSVASRGLSAFTTGLSNASSEAIDFEKKISAIRTISTESQLSFKEWGDGIRDVSSEFNIPLLEATASVYTSISNQVVSGAEAFDFLRTNANLAITAQGSISDAISATSSVMKSYNLDISSVNDISAKLFKTAELGRVPLSSIGETMGSVTVIASRAGISFDEVAASIATMTVQGIKTNKSMTFLRNIILKVLKPTEAMKKAVEEMGFATAEAAVRTLGLGRFLDELRTTTNGTASELAELLGSVRAMQAGFALSGTSLSQYEDNLIKIGNAAKDFDERIKIAKESVGFNFQKELNAGSNALSVFGQRINKVFFEVIKVFGGLTNIVESFGAVLTGLALAGVGLAINKVITSVISLGVSTVTTNIQLTTMDLLLGKTARTAKVTAFSMRTLAGSLKSLTRVLLPLLAIEGALLFFDKLASLQEEEKAKQDRIQRAITLTYKNANRNRLRILSEFRATANKINSRTTVDAIVANNKRANALKKTLSSASKSFSKFNKDRLKDVKNSLLGLKEQVGFYTKIIKGTESILKTVQAGRDGARKDLLGAGGSALSGLPDKRQKFNDAVLSGVAGDIDTSLKALLTSLKESIAGSSNQTLIGQLKSEVFSVLDRAEDSAKRIGKEALANQKKLIADKERLEKESRKRTRAQTLLDRVDPLAISKETTSAGVKLTGSASIQTLIDAKAFAPTASEKAQIQSQIDTLTEFVSRRFLQVKTAELEKSRKKSLDIVADQYEKFLTAFKKELTAGKTLDNLTGLGEGLQKVFSDAVPLKDVNPSFAQGNERLGLAGVTKAVLQFADAMKHGGEITQESRKALRDFFAQSEDLTGVSVEGLAQSLTTLFEVDTKNMPKLIELLRQLKEETQSRGLAGTDLSTRNRVASIQITGEVLKKNIRLSKGLNVELSAELSKREELDKFQRSASTESSKQAKNVVKIREEIAKINNNPVDLSGSKLAPITLKGELVQKDVMKVGTEEGAKEAQPVLEDLFTKIFSNAFGRAFDPSKFLPTDSGAAAGGAAGGAIGGKPIKTIDVTSDSKQKKKAIIDAKAISVERPITTGGINRIFPTVKRRESQDVTDIKALIFKAEGNNTLSDNEKKENIKLLKFRLNKAKDEDPNTFRGKANQLVSDNEGFQSKIAGLGNTASSVSGVLNGTSKSLDLTGLSALNTSKAFGKATQAASFFATQLLQGRQKGLSSKQKSAAILQGGIGGATAGSAFGGVGAIVGFAAGAGIAFLQTREKGGLIYRSGGGGVPAPAKGTDTVPAMLTAGEMVVNRGATDKFYPQLKAMNSMAYRADGGRVSNSTVSVGDINVSPSANSGAGGVDAVAIGNQIRNEIRKGRLGSFSS